MNRSVLKYISLIVITLLLAGYKGSAQKDTTLRQEVEVIKAYKPTISDAYKINDMPVIKDEEFK